MSASQALSTGATVRKRLFPAPCYTINLKMRAEYLPRQAWDRYYSTRKKALKTGWLFIMQVYSSIASTRLAKAAAVVG